MIKSKTSSAKTIFIFLRVGILVRNFINIDMLTALETSGHRFVILTSEPEHSVMKHYFSAPCFHLERAQTDTFKPKFAKLYQFFVLVRRITYANTWFSEVGCRHANLETIRGETFGNASFRGRCFLEVIVFMARLTSRFRWVRRVVRYMEHRLFPFTAHHIAYQTYKPSLCLAFSFGYREDALMFREARHYGVRTAVLAKNWDIATTKGYTGGEINHALVWNDFMAQEAKRFQDVPQDGIVVCGIPQWDHYFANDAMVPARPSSDRETFLESLGLDPARPVVYFATTTPMFYRDNFKIAELILRSVQDGRLPEGTQLIMRLHPAYFLNDGVMTDEAKASIDRLQTEFIEGFAVSVPAVEDEGGLKIPSASNDATLTALLAYSDVMATIYSTQMVEALFFDLPVINFGVGTFRDTKFPISHYDTWAHIQQIMPSKLIDYCYDEAIAIDRLAVVLEQRRCGESRHDDLAEAIYPHALRGVSGQKTANALIGLLERQGQ